jgi:hypothetical protein
MYVDNVRRNIRPLYILFLPIFAVLISYPFGWVLGLADWGDYQNVITAMGATAFFGWVIWMFGVGVYRAFRGVTTSPQRYSR